MHTGLYAIAVAADPQSGVLIHLAAAGIEEVIVLPNLGKAQRQNAVVIVVYAAILIGDKAGFLQSSRFVKDVPVALFGNQAIFLADPGSPANYKLAIGLRIVILAVQLVESVGHLNTVNRKVELAVFIDDLFDAVFQIRNKHLAVRPEVVHTGLYAIAVGGNPHGGVLCHLAVAAVEQIVVITDLCKALGNHIITVVVRCPINVRKTIADNVAVFAAPVCSCSKAASSLFGGVGNVAAPIPIDQTGRRREDNPVIYLNCAIERLAVFIDIVEASGAELVHGSVIRHKSAARTGHNAGFLVKVIPGIVHNVVENRWGVAIGNVPVALDPVGSFLQRYESPEPGFTCHEILCTPRVCAECTSYQLAVLIKGVEQPLHIRFGIAGQHFAVCFVEVVEVGIAVRIRNGLPTGGQHAQTRIVAASVFLKQSGELAAALTVFAKVIPELSGFISNMAGQFLDACEGSAVYVVGPAPVFPVPAAAGSRAVPVQIAAILILRHGVHEVRAGIPRDIRRIIIGIQAVLFLEVLLLRKALQNMEVRVDIVIQIACRKAFQITAVQRPCAVLRNELQAAQHAQRIDCGGINRLRLGNIVADNRQDTILDLTGGQGKQFIGKSQTGRIHRKALGHLHGYCDRCQRADTFRKLEHEVPCGSALLIAAGQHIQQLRQLFRNGNLGHIHREGVVDLSLPSLQVIGSRIILISGIGNAAFPGKYSVSIGSAEVKLRFAALVHVCRGLRSLAERLAQRGILSLDAGLLFSSVIGNRLVIGFLILRTVAFIKRIGLVLQNRANGQVPQTSGLVRGKVKAFNRACLGIVVYQLIAVGHNRFTVHNDRSEGDLHITKYNIAGIDFYRITIVACFQRQRTCFSVDNVDTALGEPEIRRLNNIQRLAAKDGAVLRDQLNLNLSLSGSRKHALSQCANLIIRNLQFAVFRNRGSTASCGDTGNGNIQAGSDSQIIIIRGDHRMVKHIGGFCSGDNHQGRADGTLIAIRGTVCDSNGFRAFRLGGQGGGTAAVQIHCRNASRVQHDPGDFNGSAACGEGLLPAIQDHKDHTPVVCNAHACTGHPGIIVAAVFGDGNLAVLHQTDGCANGFLNIVLVGRPLFGAADNGGSILENAEEVLIVAAGEAVVFHALHNESAGGCAIGHIVEVAIDTDHRAVVGDIAVRFGIAMVCFGSLHLLGDTRHAPGRGVIEAVIRIDADIAPGNIRSRNIIDNLLTILGNGHICLLRHAGSQLRFCGREHRIVGVLNLILRQPIEVVRKCVAARLTKILIDAARYITLFQSQNAVVVKIGIQNDGANLALRGDTAEAVIQEELRPDALGQVHIEVAFHDGADRAALRELFKDVESVQIAIQIQSSEGMGVGIIIEEILVVVCTDFLCHFFHRSGYTGVGSQLHQVADVSGPASQIGGLLNTGMIGHVHAAEHVGKVHRIAIGQAELSQLTQTLGAFSRAFLRRDIVDKSRVFRPAEGTPRTARILGYACADVVDYQSHRVFVGMLKRVLAGINLKLLQAGKEITVSCDRLNGLLQFLPLGIEGDISIEVYQRALIIVGCAAAVSLCVPAQELMVFPGKDVGAQGLGYADTEHLGLHRSLTAICVKENGMLHKGHSGKLCSVGLVLRCRCQLRRPAAELIGVVVVIGSGRSAARVRRHFVLKHLLFAKHSAVIVHPSDGILVQRLFKHRGEYRVLGNCRRFRIPTGEGVAVLFIVFLHGGLAGVFRNRSGSDLFSLQNGITVFPCDGQLCGLVKHRLVARVARDACGFGGPSGERIDVVVILGLFRHSGIGRNLPIGDLGFLQQCRAVFVIPGDGIFHGFACKYSLIGLICHGGTHCRSPTGESIGILDICRTDRGLAGIGRSLPFRYRRDSQNGIVPVYPIDRITSQYLIKNSGIGCITGNCGDIGTPAGKYELSVSLRRLRRNRAAVDRQLAIGNAFRFQNRAVLILPGNGARNTIRGIGGSIDNIPVLILRRVPAGEGVAVMFVSVLNRSLPTVGNCLPCLDIAGSGQFCAIVVHPGDSMCLGGSFRGVHSLVGNVARDTGQNRRPAGEVVGGTDFLSG